LNNGTSSNPKASPTITTDYIVKGYSASCFDFDTIKITVNPKPTVDVGADIIKCKNDDLTFNPLTTRSDTYLWTPSSEVTDATTLNTTTAITSSQLFKLKVSNSATGCQNEDEIYVDVKSPKAAFTVNDTFSQTPPLIVKTLNVSGPKPLTYQ
jgi:hypothetical protein